MVTFIQGGVTAPQGFVANGIHAGLKESRKTEDLALIFCQRPCASSCIFTTNRVKAEPVKLTQKNIQDGTMQAAVCNVCYANACTGERGYQTALDTAQALSKELNIKAEDIIVTSTGIIGQEIPRQKLLDAIPALVQGLSKEGHEKARCAIMTTDTKFKECAVEATVGGKKVRIGAMCKGSGMIHINMGTMLSFVTTDCDITSQMLHKALLKSAEISYNCVSVDGDTSTNDTLTIMASGLAGNEKITGEGKDFDDFMEALNQVNIALAKKIASDGEGASRMIECVVSGAKNPVEARALSKSVISSNLVKAAMFGRDANCGRIMCAMGYSGIDFNPDACSIFFSSGEGASAKKIEVVHDGVGLSFDEALAEEILGRSEVKIDVILKDGNASGTAWGCDLTYDYVKINGDYRS